MSDMDIIVSDGALRRSTTEYLDRTASRLIAASGGESSLYERDGRTYFLARVPEDRAARVKRVIEDKLSDVIAVNYKYEFFKRKVRVGGLDEVEYELLLSALISADLEDDKRYARSKLQGPPYSLDGSFTFSMKPLADKWKEVVSYVPHYFAPEELKEFVSYIVGEKRGERVYVIGARVYDGHYNQLSRAFLTGGGECGLIREIILSSSGEVELSSPIPKRDEYYLREFFGDKIFFGKGYHC